MFHFQEEYYPYWKISLYEFWLHHGAVTHRGKLFVLRGDNQSRWHLTSLSYIAFVKSLGFLHWHETKWHASTKNFFTLVSKLIAINFFSVRRVLPIFKTSSNLVFQLSWTFLVFFVSLRLFQCLNNEKSTSRKEPDCTVSIVNYDFNLDFNFFSFCCSLLDIFANLFRR